MAITVPFDLAYEFEVNAAAAEVFAVLADVPSSPSHFPKLSKLVDLGKGAYRWEMEKVGTGPERWPGHPPVHPSTRPFGLCLQNSRDF